MGAFDKLREKDARPCVLVFRYRENNFASNGRIVFSKELRFMKSLSCNGECCEGETRRRHYTPFDDVDEAGMDCLCLSIPKNAKDGDLFRAIFRPGPPDFETGYVDDWEWELVPYEKPEEPPIDAVDETDSQAVNGHLGS